MKIEKKFSHLKNKRVTMQVNFLWSCEYGNYKYRINLSMCKQVKRTEYKMASIYGFHKLNENMKIYLWILFH